MLETNVNRKRRAHYDKYMKSIQNFALFTIAIKNLIRISLQFTKNKVRNSMEREKEKK